MEQNNFYDNYGFLYEENKDNFIYEESSNNENTNSYSLNFFDNNNKNIATLYLDEESFYEDRITNYEIPNESVFFSLILSYSDLDGSIRYQIICNFCLKNKVTIVGPELVSLNNGDEVYGDFKILDDKEALNKICNFIIHSFYEKNLPVQGEYTSIMKQIEFIKK